MSRLHDEYPLARRAIGEILFGREAMSFETKDSGERAHFESGMQRDTTKGKIQWALVLDGPMLKRYAELMTRGAEKYEPRNWLKANSPEEMARFLDSAMRHFFQWANGETDEDHAAAVIFNLNGYEYVKEKLSRANEAGPTSV